MNNEVIKTKLFSRRPIRMSFRSKGEGHLKTRNKCYIRRDPRVLWSMHVSEMSCITKVSFAS